MAPFGNACNSFMWFAAAAVGFAHNGDATDCPRAYPERSRWHLPDQSGDVRAATDAGATTACATQTTAGSRATEGGGRSTRRRAASGPHATSLAQSTHPTPVGTRGPPRMCEPVCPGSIENGSLETITSTRLRLSCNEDFAFPNGAPTIDYTCGSAEPPTCLCKPTVANATVTNLTPTTARVACDVDHSIGGDRSEGPATEAIFECNDDQVPPA